MELGRFLADSSHDPAGERGVQLFEHIVVEPGGVAYLDHGGADLPLVQPEPRCSLEGGAELSCRLNFVGSHAVVAPLIAEIGMREDEKRLPR
jgi:hypothetical protein